MGSFLTSNRAAIAAVAGLATLAGAALGTAQGPAPHECDAVGDVTAARIARVADRISEDWNERHPKHVRVVRSTRRPAVELVSGDIVSSATPVYLVSMTGRFISTNARGPRGAIKVVSGRSLSITLGTRRLDVLDLSVTNTPPKLAPLGCVTSI
ncbi:MAG: hypothetical protein QOD86_2050 [Miltoncostaeaceae bacterium]|jgi:hypothetical protein|nr:hypothetical protein [Miltoncostaeaceae bacterium]